MGVTEGDQPALCRQVGVEVTLGTLRAGPERAGACSGPRSRRGSPGGQASGPHSMPGFASGAQTVMVTPVLVQRATYVGAGLCPLTATPVPHSAGGN